MRWRCCASPKRAWPSWHATTVSPCTPCAWGLLRLLRGIWSVSRLVRRERYDVVNTTSRRDALIAAAGARLGGTPLVIRSRHLMSPVNSLLTYTGLPHRVMTVSSFVKQLLTERGIPAEHIGIVPPIAVPPRWSEIRKADPWQCLQEVRAEVRAELGFSEQDIVVGCVAVLRGPKGMPTSCRRWCRCAGRIRTCTWW